MKLKFLLFVIVLFICPFVYAQDFNVTSTITSPTGGGATGTYKGLEIYNTGLPATYNVNTRYNGRLSQLEFNIPIPSSWPDGSCFSSGDLVYTLTLNMATNDWRNNFARPFISWTDTTSNWATSNITFVSRKQIKFTFKVPSDGVCYSSFYVIIKSTNVSDVYITGETNWNLSSVVLSANFPTSGGGSGSGSGSGSTGATNQDIINNQNSNTNAIINNNTQNTQSIIENNNDNTQQIIDNQNKNAEDIQNTINDNLKDCHMSRNLLNTPETFDVNVYRDFSITLPIGTYTLSADNIVSTGSSRYMLQITYDNGTSSYFHISRSTFNVTFTTMSETVRFRFYSQDNYQSSQNITTTFTKVMLNTGSSPLSYEPYGQNICVSKIDETNNAINNVNDTLNNDNIDDDLGNGFFDDFDDEDFGLSQIITIPLTTIENLTSSSCVSLHVPIPFTSSYVDLPCMTQVYEENIPTIYNIWKIVSFGIISYFICIDIFHIVKGFKDPDSDKIEVLDL